MNHKDSDMNRRDREQLTVYGECPECQGRYIPVGNPERPRAPQHVRAHHTKACTIGQRMQEYKKNGISE